MTPGEITELGERVAEVGPATHDLLLRHLSTLVAAAAPGAAAALADRSAPDIVRMRALATASAVLLRQRISVASADDLAA